tara:strand:- start:58 stop:1689 length:1632 start_codon:yes stop_codon:yes gene_type:complete
MNRIDILDIFFKEPTQNKIYKIGSRRGLKVLYTYMNGGFNAENNHRQKVQDYTFEHVGKFILLDDSGLVCQIRLSVGEEVVIEPIPILYLNLRYTQRYFEANQEQTFYDSSMTFSQWYDIYYSQWDIGQKIKLSDYIRDSNTGEIEIMVGDNDGYVKPQILALSRNLAGNKMTNWTSIEDLDKASLIAMFPYNSSNAPLRESSYNLNPCYKIKPENYFGTKIEYALENPENFVLIYDEEEVLINCFNILTLYSNIFKGRSNNSYYEILDDEQIHLHKESIWGDESFENIKEKREHNNFIPSKKEILEMKKGHSYYDIEHMVVDESSLVKILQSGKPNIVKLVKDRHSRGLVSKGVALGLEYEFFSDPGQEDTIGSVRSAYHGSPKTRKQIYRAEFFEPNTGDFSLAEPEPVFETLSLIEWWEKFAKSDLVPILPYGGDGHKAGMARDRESMRYLFKVTTDYNIFKVEEQRIFDVKMRERTEEMKQKNEEENKHQEEHTKILKKTQKSTIPDTVDLLDLMDSLHCGNYIVIKDKLKPKLSVTEL